MTSKPDPAAFDAHTADPGEQGSPECLAVLLVLSRNPGGLKAGEAAALANVPAPLMSQVLGGLRRRGMAFRMGASMASTWFTKAHFIAQGGQP